MPSVASISQQIWDMKYRLKGPDGAPIDKTIEDTWQRIATALAEPEPPELRAQWSARFATALESFRFLPAGRVVAGAGSGRNVTLFNCFVMGTIPDDMSGIFTHLREAALTMQQGGGIGYDFSTLRPKGAPVRGVGADASGPLSFMDVWDAMCRTIMSAGHRRGAMMGTLSCDHPDIEAFIAAKSQPGRLRMFNLSVLVTDAFMTAVKEDAPWELKFAGTTYKVLSARELWDKIMRATYAYAEPGVIFIDRINRRNNLHYCEEIHATNPCVTADTWVQTVAGPRQVAELVGKPFTALVDGKPRRSGPEGFFATGTKPVFRLATREGHSLRLTGDHKVLTAASRARSTLRREWRRADELRPGDLVVLNDHRAAAAWPGAHDGAIGLSLGYLVGWRLAGSWGEQRTLRAAAGGGAYAAIELPPFPRAGEGRGEGYLQLAPAIAESAARSPHPALSRTRERAKRRASLQERAQLLAAEYLDRSGNLSPEIEKTSSAFCIGLLAGIFDEAGSFDVSGGQAQLTVAASDTTTRAALQRMLLRLGIVSRIEHGALTIAGPSALRFAGVVIAPSLKAGLGDSAKRAQLLALIGHGGTERFCAEVASVEPDGEAPVFDAQIPGVNAFDANGIYVHNCGEQPLPPYGACLLGSINLAALIREPFEPTAHLDLAELARLVPLAVRMMDNVVDASRFPLEAQTAEAKAKRRIGLGVTGLADALILCRVRYGSSEAVALTESWMKALRREAYLASAALAAEKGAFPLFDRDAYLAGESVKELDEDVRAAIAAHGIRNSLLTSIAPTGTISIFADNVSSGLEPVFSFRYTRNVLMPDGTRKEEEVSDFALRLFHRLKGETAKLPDYFVDAQSLSPGDHLVMQAAVQKYIDSSISKTINLPADIAFESFKDVYLQAYELGCKGCTTYRPNEITGAVLEVRKEGERPSSPPPMLAVTAAPPSREPELPLPPPVPKHADIYEAGGVVYMTQPLSRPESLPGQTYKIKWPDGDHAIYITVNDVVQDGRRRPFEIFINSKNMEHYAWTVGLTRMISAVFRRGGDVSFVVEELKAVFDPRGGAWMGGKYVPSLLAAIGDVIERHMIDIGFLPARGEPAKAIAARQVVNLPSGGSGLGRVSQCPKCGEAALIRIEGCDQCTSCGYSKCG